MANGVYPLGTKEMEVIKKRDNRLHVKEHAANLLDFEQQLFANDETNTKKRRRRKRSSNTTIIEEEGEEDVAEQTQPAQPKKAKLSPKAKSKEMKKANKNAKKQEETNDEKPPEAVQENGCSFRKNNYGQVIKKLSRHEIKELKGWAEAIQWDMEEDLRLERRKKRRMRLNNVYKDTEECFRRKSGVWHVEDFSKSPEEMAALAKQKRTFAENDWDVPLEMGEVELYIPANKYRVKKLNKKLQTPEKNLVKNPFASPRTPNSSAKKVKIALNLNRSQETSEYEKQLRASPQIPFDAERKPSKPLLKPNCVPSPINPFYKKKLRMSMN